MSIFDRNININTVRDLLVDQLKDLHSAEDQIANALPEMAEHATDAELRKSLRDHLEETVEQKNRLERIFENFDEDPMGETCEAMKGIIKEGRKLMTRDGIEGAVRDAAIIAAARRVEHYEIAAYTTAIQLARVCGMENVASTLKNTLDEELAANSTLTLLAESEVNERAKNEHATVV